MSGNTPIWRVRPAEATHGGKPVAWPRLSAAITAGEVGELDEVLAPGEIEWLPVIEHPVAALSLAPPVAVKPREVEEAESDMTPMIDVTFQLLIFFMIAATYTVQKTLDVPGIQPDAEGASTVTMEELERNNIIVKIAADGAVTIQDAVVPLEEVEARIQEAASGAKSSELVLDVHDDAVHDVVVQVLDAAGAAAIEKVLFVSRGPPAASGP
jgi:biopolymer transport protein ExbD